MQHFFEEVCERALGHPEQVLDLFQGLRDATGVDAGLEWNEWKHMALERYKGDSGLQKMLRRQESELTRNVSADS